MFFADFETTTDKVSTEYSKVWLWGVKGGLPGDKMDWGLSMESFIEHIIKEKKSLIFFHNLSFDGNYIYKWLLDNEFEFKYTMEGERDLDKNEWTWICDERGSIYQLTINFDGYVIDFLDSWKVLMASVADLGKSINLDKLEMDYDAYDLFTDKKDVPDVAIEYLERDIDVVIQTFTKVIGIYDRKMTRASMAYNDFMEFYGPLNFSKDFGGKIWNFRDRCFEYKNILSVDEWKMINKSYQGGYTNWNKNFTNQDLDVPNGVSYDVNSLYPSVMLNEKYPYGRVLYSKPYTKDHVALHTIIIKSARIKDDNYPPLIKKKGGKYKEAKYLKYLENEERVYWDEELKFIMQYYDIIYIPIKTVYFKTKMVFDKWLDIKKDLKIQAKDTTERNFHKGIYNSLYGKFGQNRILGSRVIVKDGKTPDQWHKRQLRYGPDKEYIHSAKFMETDQLKYIPVASFTTMKARIALWKAMYSNLDIWLYSDTDSCYYSEEPKGLDVDGYRFGAWKPEHKFNRFKVLRSKAYIYFATHEYDGHEWVPQNEVVKKISGISKKGKKLVNWDNFHLGSVIENAKTAVKNVDGGKLIMDSSFKLGDDTFL